MREQRNFDPKYVHLLRSKTLDPANQERLRSLQQKYQILDQGLRECDTILNNQWEEYKNKNNRFTRLFKKYFFPLYPLILLNQKHGFVCQWGQIKDHNSGICCFSAKRAALRNKEQRLGIRIMCLSGEHVYLWTVVSVS